MSATHFSGYFIVAIASNKYPGVRAAACHDEITAEMSRRHNDANVLCLSADLFGERNVEPLLKIWLNTDFEGGRHERRVQKISKIEKSLDSE
jgi:ribose 5-phosphate isomerase B